MGKVMKKKTKKKIAKKKPAVKKKTVAPKKASKQKKPVLQMAPTANTSTQKIRVLIAKPGLDGHDRGAKVIARALMDAGFEVVYTGLHQTPQMIIHAAIEEDVHVVGISILSGAHNALVPEIINGIKKQGGKDVMFLVGGIIPEEDIKYLKKVGVEMVFTPGASLQAVVDYIKTNVKPRRLA